MIAFLEHIVTVVYKFFAKRYIYFLARRNGYRVTDFEWLPNGDEERIVRLRPLHDDFPHTDDNCLCQPKKSVRTDDKGEDFILIQHREMVEHDT